MHDVERVIAEALDRTASAVGPTARAAADLLTPLAAVSRGGKRLRARLVLAAHDAFGGARGAEALDVAAAIELFQTAALVHDDVLDSADTRRGQPTIHRALERTHDAESWTGDAAHFGTAGAILAGDLTLMASHRCLARAVARLGGTHGERVADLFADMAQLCTAGQYLDMRIAAQPVAELALQGADIVTTMRSKTSSYTTEFPLALGAAVAGAPDDAVEAMRDVGVPLGIAFQLRDDVLGLVGAPEVTGKPAGDDVREGKRTLLASHAWAHTDDEGRAVIEAAFGVPEAGADAIDAAVQAMVAAGAVEAVEQRIEEEADAARAALRRAQEAGWAAADAFGEIEALIDTLAVRTA